MGLLRPPLARAAVADLDFASAVAAADAIRRGEISSVELTQRMLDRIARFNPKLNAIVTLTADAALARAKAADEARARGESWGRFHGVPCTVKDTLETAGVRTTAGSPQYTGHVPTRDAAIVARLRAAGVVILGKTNVPPLAADWQSANPIFGVSNNPWDLTRTPGGSTGGGAAALAAGLTFLEPGSDIGGSIRIPAHFCGVYGHKPTLNVIPQRGHIPPPPGVIVPPPALPVVGPLARSAADLLAAMEVLGGPEGDDARAYRWTLPPARSTRLTDYRLGFVLDDPACPVASDVREVLARAIDGLRRAGVKLEEGWPTGVNRRRTVRHVPDAAVRDDRRRPAPLSNGRRCVRSPPGRTTRTWRASRARSPPRRPTSARCTAVAWPRAPCGRSTSARTTHSSCRPPSWPRSRTTRRPTS